MKLQKEKIKEVLKWIVFIFIFTAFIVIAKEALTKETLNLDADGYKIIKNIFKWDCMPYIAKAITNFGGAIFLVVLTVAIIVFMKKEKIELTIALNLVIAPIINALLKNVLKRPRPIGYNLINESGYSFPSGHSMVSMAFYGFLIYLIFKYIKNKKIKIVSIILLSMLILSIGISRIYLGVHYTSDVLGGYLLAISYLIIYTSVIKKFLKEEKND